MDDERRMTPAERTEEMVRCVRRLAELEYEYRCLEQSISRDLVLEEILKYRSRIERLNEDREEQHRPARKAQASYRSGKKFYYVAFALLVAFLITGAVVAAVVTVAVILVNYFTTEPPEPPAYAGASSAIVKE